MIQEIPAARADGVDVARQWWSGKRVAVWGAARSGLAAAQLLARLGAQVTLSDPKPASELSHLDQLPSSIQLALGAPNQLGDAEILIPSPGLKPTHPLILDAISAGVRIMSEVELAARITRAQIIAITGTDGKSTTTTLIHEALTASGLWCKAVGNLGDPMSNWALDAPDEGYFSLEVSAFQLWSTAWLDASIGVITNIAEDHYDYFDHSAERYRESKLRLLSLLKREGYLLYPADIIRLSVEELNKLPFGAEASAYTYPQPPVQTPLIGGHNQLNLAATFKVIERLGLSSEIAQNRLMTYTPLPYRMTLTRERDGVQYINDSKATNVHAACAGLSTLEGDLIVITGGYDKGLDLTPLITLFKQRVHTVLTIGQTGPKIGDLLEGSSVHCISCIKLDVAVKEAASLARAGDKVCFLPAASSFDQFTSYEARGAYFDQLVLSL